MAIRLLVRPWAARVGQRKLRRAFRIGLSTRTVLSTLLTEGGQQAQRLTEPTTMSYKVLIFPPRESTPIGQPRTSPDLQSTAIKLPAKAAFLTPNYTDAPYYALPFIHPHQRGGQWSPPPCADYFNACLKGREYAAHLAQFLKHNPLLAGGNTLANVARAIDYTDPSQHGYWVGLFSYLELLVLDGAMLRPVFEDWREYESGVRRELCHVLPRGGV